MNKKNAWMLAVASALVFGSVAAVAQPHGPAPQMQQGPGHKAPAGGAYQAHRPGPVAGPAAGAQRPQMQHPGAMPGPQFAPPGGRPAHPHGMPPGQAKRMGSGPQHNWVQGSYLPPQYRSNHYVVNDWRGHGLKSPPRGYHWVQYGGDYLLVALATGVITQLILGR